MDPLLPLPLPPLVPSAPASTAASSTVLAAGIAAEAEAVLAQTVTEVAAVVATGETVTVPATLLAPPPAPAGGGETTTATIVTAAATAAGLPPGTRAMLRLIAVTPPGDGPGGAAVEIELAPAPSSEPPGSDAAIAAGVQTLPDESGGEPVTVGIVAAPPGDAGSGTRSAAATVIASPLGSWVLARKLALPADTLVRFALFLPPDAGSTGPVTETAGDAAPLAATLLALPSADAPNDSGAVPPVALWPGMRAMLRLLAVTPPGDNTEIRLASADAPPPPSAGIEITTAGTIADAPDTGGRAATAGTAIASPLGTWALARPLALPPDTLVRFVLLLPAAAEQPAAAAAPPAASPLADLVRAALALLDREAATEAGGTLAMPAEIRGAFASPRSGVQLAAAMVLGAAAIAVHTAEDRPDGDGAGIEPPSPVAALARIAAAGGRDDLAAALAKAALPSPSAVPPEGVTASRTTVPARWTEAALPVLDDTGSGGTPAPAGTPPMPPVMLLLENPPRPYGERESNAEGDDGADEGGERGGRRFAVTLELSRLGPVQIDGAVRRGEPNGASGAGRRHLALTVRTGVALPPALRTGLAETFTAALDAAGFTGALAFAPLRRAGGSTARRPIDLRA